MGKKQSKRNNFSKKMIKYGSASLIICIVAIISFVVVDQVSASSVSNGASKIRKNVLSSQKIHMTDNYFWRDSTLEK